MDEIEICALRVDDAAAAGEFSDRVWRAYDVDRGRPERPAESPDEVERARRRFARQAVTDPDDSHAAWVADRLVGVALARRREAFWGLSLLLVDPDAQGRGLGGRLLERALASSAGASLAMISSSEDPRAMARYRFAGFGLHPALRAAGRLDRSALPRVDGAREGTEDDFAAIDELGRRMRGGGYAPDLADHAEEATLCVVERGGGLGWAFVRGSEVSQVGGSDVEVARDALFAALATAEPDEAARSRGEDARVRHMTAEQDWAVDAVLATGLRLEPSGPICVRGGAPPRPYLPHGMIF